MVSVRDAVQAEVTNLATFWAIPSSIILVYPLHLCISNAMTVTIVVAVFLFSSRTYAPERDNVLFSRYLKQKM